MNLDIEAKRRNIEVLGRSDTVATLACFTLFVLFLLWVEKAPQDDFKKNQQIREE